LNIALQSVFYRWKGGEKRHSTAEEGDEPVVYYLLPSNAENRWKYWSRRTNICIMYLWFVLLETGLFPSTIDALPKMFQADDGIAPHIHI
jgi:hypothetical protein